VPELEDEGGAEVELSVERYAELGAGEQFVLTLSQNGFGKRSSAYEYRVSGRGGKGIIAMIVNDRNGDLAGSFPVEDGDEIMLVTNGGQLIRCPVSDVRVAGRNTQGVTVFKTAADEQVVSVEHISEVDSEDEGDASDDTETDGSNPDNSDGGNEPSEDNS
jgi:DNA gyrase subunit A